MTKFVSKLVVSSLTLAGITMGLLAGAPPAEAKKMSCLQKYRACNQRCFRYGDPVPCIHRTCEPQMDNCLGANAVGPDLILPALVPNRREGEGQLTPWDRSRVRYDESTTLGFEKALY